MRTLVWFRGHDLRLADHAPLRDALARGEAFPVFVLDPRHLAPRRAREAPHRVQFLLESLAALDEAVRSRGSELLILEGPSEPALRRAISALGAERVVAHLTVTPSGRARDEALRASLPAPLELFPGQTLSPPERVRTKEGRPYAVFTPFSRRFHEVVDVDRPLPTPRRITPIPRGARALRRPIPTLESLGLARNPHLPEGGERAAGRRLRRFLDGPAARYHLDRDRLDLEGTSRLSADLKFGTLSPRAVFSAVDAALEGTKAARAFHDELIWREFAHATLWDRPEVLERPFRSAYEGFPVRADAAAWRAWVEGRTGYPVIDAASRQLLTEGFVHNRARMITASFLAKHLLLDFRRGEAHFLRFLVDGDPAQNDAGWQWSAGCGADAQPWFRVFNPVSQGRRFDPTGGYVRRWLPELGSLPDDLLHAPWEAPPEALRAARVRLGETYPRPIVDHREARERYLATARAHLGSTAQRR